MEFSRKAYVDKLAERTDNGLIKIITGTRRAGKSYLMNELFYRFLTGKNIPARQIIRFAFDSDEDLDLIEKYYPDEPVRISKPRGWYLVNAKKFRAFIREKTDSSSKFYLLLDEVQMLENFAGTLNGLLRHKNFDIYVTGSNSRFLSSDIATEFKGRGSQIHVFPLTFFEYCEGLSLEPGAAWKNYIETGGIPLVTLMKSDEEKREYLKDLCEETYLKDIIAHRGIRKNAELSETFDILASMIGSPVNCLKIANTFKSIAKKSIADDTIAAFIDYFEDAFILSKAKKYNIKGRRYISSPFKLYFEDIGVRNARLNFRQIEESHIMENIIYNELRYRGFDVDVGEVSVNEKTDRLNKAGKNIYTQNFLEVDFIARKGSEKYYVQSALSLPDETKRAREVRPLYYIDDSFEKIILTKNGLNPARDEKGVITVDVFDFLTNKYI